jgi:hypothetical protein
MTGISTYLVLPASADSPADLVLSLKCQGGYNVNVWKRYNSGELLYRSTSPQGNLSWARELETIQKRLKFISLRMATINIKCLVVREIIKGRGL